MPFNWRTPIGYFSALKYEISVGIYMNIVSTMELGFVFAFGWIFFAFTEEIQTDLIELSKENKTKGKCEIKIIKRVCNLTQYYSDVKQLSRIQFEIKCVSKAAIFTSKKQSHEKTLPLFRPKFS